MSIYDSISQHKVTLRLKSLVTPPLHPLIPPRLFWNTLNSPAGWEGSSYNLLSQGCLCPCPVSLYLVKNSAQTLEIIMP